MTNKHTSLEKYTSHTLFSKGLRKGCVWEVSWRLNRLQHIDPKFLWFLQHFFLILLGCSPRGTEGPSPLLGAGSHSGILSPTTTGNYCLELNSACLGLQLTNSNYLELSVAPGYIIVWRPLASCEHHICTEFNPSVGKVIPWYLRADAPVSRLTAGLKVNMLQIFFCLHCTFLCAVNCETTLEVLFLTKPWEN